MSTCTRAWEVEAARDGRLTGHERSSLLRHVSICAHCAREHEHFETLARALRTLPVRSADQLTVRRQRQALLARACGERTQTVPSRRPWWRASALVVALACGLLVLCAWPAHINKPTAARLTVKPELDAQYTRSTDGGVHVVELKQGRLTFEVERFESEYGVVVRTPDGEIEDIGTVFTVAVHEGRTEAISVVAGRVVARIAGGPAQGISAGETWRPYARGDLVQPDSTDATAKANAKAPARHRSPREPRVLHEVVSTNTGVPSSGDPAVVAPQALPITNARASSGATAMADSEATRQFSLAVASVEAHDDANALMLLKRFAIEFPRDSRAEDAAYLRVVVLVRGTDRAAVRTAARAYLDAYPRGFRVPEVARLLARDAEL